MPPLDLVKLPALMKRTTGNPAVKLGFIDGPVFTRHSDLTDSHIHEIPGSAATCSISDSNACLHGTFVAGILIAKRDTSAPAVCPGCALLIRPVFTETANGNGAMPSSTPEELAAAVVECVDAGATVINLSLALARPSTRAESALEQAFNYAARRNVIVVAAAGNQGALGSSAITRHQWVIPVTACDMRGRPTDISNLGRSIGQFGLSAPGENVTSLRATGGYMTLGGTSIAAPFVTGTIALLMSLFPGAPASQIKLAVTSRGDQRRSGLVPPLLDAEAAFRYLENTNSRRITNG